MKIRMLFRHTHPSGKKLEQGAIYDFPEDYANELFNHGLAVLIVEPPEIKIEEVEKVIPMKVPGFAKVSHKKATQFKPKASK